MNFTEINQYMFQHSANNIKWFDKTGIIEIDEDRIVEIELCISNVVDKYDRYKVTIINKHNGEIASKYFTFDECLNQNDRIDNRSDYTGGFHFWRSDRKEGWGWYIAIPSEQSIDNLVRSMFDYIEFYR